MTEQEILNIRQVCADLMVRFANANDAMRYHDLVALFAEDGAFARPTAPDTVLQGKQAILAAFESRPKDRVTRHIISNIQIDVRDASHASGLCYAILYSGNQGDMADKFGLRASASQFVGEFHDEFVLTPEGWRFASRRGKIIFTT